MIVKSVVRCTNCLKQFKYTVTTHKRSISTVNKRLLLSPFIPTITDALSYVTTKQQIQYNNPIPSDSIPIGNPTNDNTTSTWQQYHSEHYIPLSPLQRMVLFLSSSTLATLDTYRGDMVATVAETVQTNTQLEKLYKLMQSNVESQQLLHDKPRIRHDTDCWSMSYLGSLQHNTLGYAYYKFMSEHGYSANERSPVRFISNPEYAYIIQRYREVHDIWHILLDFTVSVQHEIAQKYFEYIHTGLTIGYLSSSSIAQLNLSATERHELNTLYIPYLNDIHNNITNKHVNLLCIYYEKYLEHDIDELREKWAITPVSQMQRIVAM